MAGGGSSAPGLSGSHRTPSHGCPSPVNGFGGGGTVDAPAILAATQSNVFLRCLPAAAAVASGGGGLKNAFVIVQITRFQQVIGVFTLQAPNEALKVSVGTPSGGWGREGGKRR